MVNNKMKEKNMLKNEYYTALCLILLKTQKYFLV